MNILFFQSSNCSIHLRDEGIDTLECLFVRLCGGEGIRGRYAAVLLLQFRQFAMRANEFLPLVLDIQTQLRILLEQLFIALKENTDILREFVEGLHIRNYILRRDR